MQKRRCSNTRPHGEHVYYWAAGEYACIGKAEPKRLEYHVVLIMAADGTPSIVGTADGRPFRSVPAAQEIADSYERDGLDAAVLPIEACESDG